jgi:hypothetical protein
MSYTVGIAMEVPQIWKYLRYGSTSDMEVPQIWKYLRYGSTADMQVLQTS